MDFGLDPTQREIAELAGKILDRAIGPDTGLDTGPGGSAPVWPALAEAGLLGLALPEHCGGDGLGLGGAAVVLTELGRRALPTPVLATLALGALPLVRHGTRPQQGALLPAVVRGDRVLTAALHEPSEPLPARPRTLARREGDWFVVTGTKVMVPYADRADRVLVPVTIENGGSGLLIVDPLTPGAGLTPAAAAGHEPHHHLRLDGVRVPVTDLVGAGGQSENQAAVRDLYQVAVVAAALTADGLLAGALALTAAHVGTRQQFGRPLATLQAVAQQVAEIYVTSRALHLAAWSACWRLAEGRDPGADPAVAAYWVAEQLRPALARCHHLHGGLGLDRSYPLHHFSAAAAELTWFVGGPERNLELLGDELYGTRGN
jgi:alkylation response protein AidB-like acyl-CoA dehydrogenase